MRLVTWNVNSLKARLPRVLEFLAEHEPDALLMQETKCAPEAFPVDELAAAGYGVVHHSGGRWAGVAIASREQLPASDVVVGLDGESDVSEARWIEATVGGLRLVSTYVPNGRALDDPMFAAKMAFLDAARERVAALHGAGAQLVVAGDFNVAPADVDVYDPPAFVGSTHVTADERGRLAALCEAGDLVDAFRAKHGPDEVGYTWWDYRQGHFHRGFGLRIDMHLVSRALGDRIERIGIDRTYRKGTKPSDHAPLLLDLA